MGYNIIYISNFPRRWSQLAYAGTIRVPPAADPEAHSWPLFFLQRYPGNLFADAKGNPIAFELRHPGTIDFDEQLYLVQQTLANLNQDQICTAEYWNAGPVSTQWVPIVHSLMETYGIGEPRASRILGAFYGGLNDAAVVTWYFKFLLDIPRPNQLDQELATITCTPYHPSYPAGHSVLAGCAEVILSYFFSPEASRLRRLAEECSMSRLYAGVHYPIDGFEGLRLGRQIGRIITGILDNQHDSLGIKIDYLITEGRQASLQPPPYRQVIRFSRPRVCSSLLDPRQCPEAR